MNAEIAKEIRKKCKEKQDGVYSHKKYKYITVNGQLRAWCSHWDNEVYECSYGFNIHLGNIQPTPPYTSVYDSDRVKKLKELLRQYQN